MPIDERTPRMGLEKPAETNPLKIDVDRLRQTLDIIDAKTAIVVPRANAANPDDVELDPTLIPDAVPKIDPATDAIDDQYLDDNIPRMTLDAKTQKWKLQTENLPAGAQMTEHTVTTTAEMVTLDKALLGDLANVYNGGAVRTFILARLPASERNNWKELLSNPVTSINGYTGDVIVANVLTNPNADITTDPMARSKGRNTNITGLDSLSGGPLKLGGAGIDDEDAVNVRQLRAAMGTSGGASMTGVMNNFIGAIEWFSGYSRTALPAGYIPADGQELNRADYPDLFEAVKKGMFGSTLETTWLLQPTERGKYSYGTQGTATTGTKFRVPDLNGMFTPTNATGGLPSIGSVYLRGSKSTEPAGVIKENGAPNITGTFGRPVNAGTGTLWETDNWVTGAVRGVNLQTKYLNLGAWTPTAGNKNVITAQTAVYPTSMELNASRSSPAYGRDGTTEVRPNTAHGIWIIRAKGAFHSANNKFEVINAYNPMPAVGQAVTGGFVQGSLNDENGNTVNAVGMTVNNTVGKNPVAVFGVANYVKNPTTNAYALSWKHMDLDWDTGKLSVPGEIGLQRRIAIRHSGGDNAAMVAFCDPNETVQGAIYGERQGDVTISVAGGTKYFQFLKTGNATFPASLTLTGNITASSQTWPSDRALKDDIKPITDALGKIDQLTGYSFTLKTTGMKSAGIIAQDLEKVMPDLVSTLEDGHLAVQYNGVIGLLVASVKELKAEVDDLKSQLAVKP